MSHLVSKLLCSRVPAAVLCMFVLVVTTARSHADIAANSWLLNTRAELVLDEGFFPDLVTEAADDEEGPTPVLPLNLTHTATGLANVQEGTSTYDFSTAGDSGLFSFSFDHIASAVYGPFDSSLTGSDGFLSFTPDSDVAFSLSGFYTLTGTGIIHLSLSLTDENDVEVFNTAQETDNVMNQSFALGANNGLLEGGKRYTLAYDFHVGGLDLGNVSGTGGFDLQLGVAAAPAPGAAALGLIGLGFIAWFGRRQS